jgi:hypothetical protein
LILVRRVDDRCGAKAGEIKALFKNTLDATRTAALRDSIGLPRHDARLVKQDLRKIQAITTNEVLWSAT